MLQQLSRWLGKIRTRILVGAFMITGLASLALSLAARDEAWSLSAQTFLIVIFLAVAAVVVGSRLQRDAQLRMAFMVGPALGLALLALVLPSGWFPLVLGVAFGWLIAAQFLLRSRMPTEYKTAIKALRRQDYKEAAGAVSGLIEQEPNNPNHYRFRAEMYRLGGHMKLAIKDYEQIIALDADAAMGYNGLAEVYLQQKKYAQAHEAAEKAFALEPDYWVAPYNLGMIEDRLGQSEAVIEHLHVVLQQGLPDSRHRLLTYLWLARAHARLGDVAQADAMLAKMRQERKGLREWTIILGDEQAATLRTVLEADVELAKQALETDTAAATLFREEDTHAEE